VVDWGYCVELHMLDVHATWHRVTNAQKLELKSFSFET